jgi:hypothetical protein
VVVVAAGRKEHGTIPVILGELKAQQVAVKKKRPFQVRYLQVHVPDACLCGHYVVVFHI